MPSEPVLSIIPVDINVLQRKEESTLSRRGSLSRDIAEWGKLDGSHLVLHRQHSNLWWRSLAWRQATLTTSFLSPEQIPSNHSSVNCHMVAKAVPFTDAPIRTSTTGSFFRRVLYHPSVTGRQERSTTGSTRSMLRSR